MKLLNLTVIAVIATVALWQLTQRHAHDQKLTDLRTRLAQRAASVTIKPQSTFLPPRPSRSTSSLEKPSQKPNPAPAGKLTLSETLTKFGEALGPGRRRLMELRDQLPADKRVPFDDIFKLIGSVDELNISDLDLKTELIQEAEVVMRTMIGTLTSIPPKNTIKLSTNKGDVNMTPFMIGYIGSALALDETERSRLSDALSTHESPKESLRHHLSEEQYQLMIELTRGRRFHELSESEREEPLDLMDDINSLF